jgi:MoxR-like ATPase
MTQTIPSVFAEVDLSLEHLQTELSRIDLLIQRAVRRWQLAGQDPLDAFRGLSISAIEADTLLARPFGAHWGATVVESSAEVEAFKQAQIQANHQAQSLIKTANQPLRLAQLATTFGLTRFELDILLICLAPTLDLRYERLYAFLQDDVTRKRPTINLTLDLLTEPGPARLKQLAYFADESPLFKYHLLERSSESGQEPSPLLSQTLRVDEAIVAWLLGRYQPHADLAPYAYLLNPQELEADSLLAAPVQPDLKRVAYHGLQPILIFYGPDRVSQEAAARLLAMQVGRPLLVVDLAGVVKTDLAPLPALRLALRDALLTGALLCLLGWDVYLTREDSAHLLPELLAELCNYPDLVIVAGRARWQAEGIDRRRTLLWLEFPIPTYPQRMNLWQHFLGSSSQKPVVSDQKSEVSNQKSVVSSQKPVVGLQGAFGSGQLSVNTDNRSLIIDNCSLTTDNRSLVSLENIAALAGQFTLTTGQIRDAVASAHDIAAQRGEALQHQDLFAAARVHSNPRLASLARKITPRYSWSDLILPADQLSILRELVSTVRGRPVVLEQWGVGKKLASSAAVTALFAGDPGTGKTMAAEVIAAELSLDLYKIDLSMLVSKYIGETEKNLERIFSEAESSNAILFFDEADSIFGKRSEVKDAHDRYANIEVSYLLQRMESYDGVTILATNLRSNLDEAFTRRLQFVVDFPFPDQDYRLRIWQTLFPPEVPRAPELDFTLLARRFKLAGGNIRNIIISASYLAASNGGQVSMEHLLHGARRELQKMGRLVNEADLRVEKP